MSAVVEFRAHASKNANQSVSNQIYAWLQRLIIFPQLRQLLSVVEASTR